MTISAIARVRLLLPLLAVLVAGCGNKGPLFLPPPAVQQPETSSTTPGGVVEEGAATNTGTPTPAPEAAGD